jgi:hypothetical protein
VFGALKRLQLFSLVIIALLLLAPSSARTASVADSYNPNKLSYGLYWFGLNGDNQKFVSGETNPYFNPAKPTLIFVHGWQPFISNKLPDFDFNGTDTAAGWINNDWNVGIFVWNQFADETTGVTSAWFGDGPPPQGVLDAEAKIWTPNGPQGMRWRDWNDDDPLPIPDGYSDAPPGTPSSAELFYQAYVDALPETYTQTIRIAGHSLGNQMAVRLTKLVDEGITAGEVSEELRPARVALLDPYWSPDPRDDLSDSEAAGRKVGNVVRDYIADLTPSGTLFEWYWSSTWTTPPQGDANDALKPMTFYAEMDPTYTSEDLDKHMAPRYLYFWSYEFPQSPPCTGIGDDCQLLGQMSDAQLASLMRSDFRWEQNSGQDTDTPDDDTYQSVLQSGAPYTVTLLTASPVSQTVGGTVTITATVTSSDSPTSDGTLVSFATDLGEITPRVVVSNGLATARLAADIIGTAHISATTQGAGGAVQSTTTVTFTAPVSDCISLTDAAIKGPVGVTGTLFIGSQYTFNAVITPTDATTPITYTWTPTPTNGQNRDTAEYRWSEPDRYTVTLTAENCGGPVVAPPREAVIEDLPYQIYLPLTLRND